MLSGKIETAIRSSFKQKTSALIIMDPNNQTSVVASRRLLKSIQDTESAIEAVLFPATTPDTLDSHLKEFGLTRNDWTYPSTPGESRIDMRSGLTLSAYNAKDIRKVMACAVSHMRLWKQCAMRQSAFIILEHDAIFTRKFDILSESTKSDRSADAFVDASIIGLNDPRRATRKSGIYLQRLLDSREKDQFIYNVPYVDDDDKAPQGLAGNSAYFIRPSAASQLLAKIEQMGIWPNDALMCKQFIPGLRQAYPFFTTLQGVQSTTQG